VAAVTLALNRHEPGDTAAVLGGSTLRQARGANLEGTTVSVLSRDRISQALVADTRMDLSRSQTAREQVNGYLVEFHKKWAIAFACLIFTLIGPPLALRFPRGGVGLVVAGSTVIFALYWVGLIAGESLADRRLGDPMVTMWVPNAVFLVAGLFLVQRMGRAGGTTRGGGGFGDLLWRVGRGLKRLTGGGRRPAEGTT